MTTPPEVQVPLVLGRVQAGFTHASLHDVDALLALRPADELANQSVEDSSEQNMLLWSWSWSWRGA